jgi:hypothetical protein
VIRYSYRCVQAARLENVLGILISALDRDEWRRLVDVWRMKRLPVDGLLHGNRANLHDAEKKVVSRPVVEPRSSNPYGTAHKSKWL